MQVKWWNTINENKILAMGYSVPIGYAPNILIPGHGQYLAVHTALLSHTECTSESLRINREVSVVHSSNFGRDVSATHACNDRSKYYACV